MATLKVPSVYATIAKAMAAARAGDTIAVSSGYHGHETVLITADHLTIDAPADVSGIQLLIPGLSNAHTLKLTGQASITCKAMGVSLDAGEGSAVVFGVFGNETISSGNGDDRVFVDRLDSTTIRTGRGDDTLVLISDGLPFGQPYDPSIIDGGPGADTLIANQLFGLVIKNVENLDTRKVHASVAQLQKFDRVSDSRHEHTTLQIDLFGRGGVLDFSKILEKTDSVDVDAHALLSGLTIIATEKADTIIGTSYRDVINGAGGNDVIQLAGGARASGTVDGGNGRDTVYAADLGGYEFKNVEVLQVAKDDRRHPEKILATLEQLNSFQSIYQNYSQNKTILIELSGEGGTIDFSRMISSQNAVHLETELLTSGLRVKGSNGADDITTTRFNDAIDGGGGADYIHAYVEYDRAGNPQNTSGGRDTINGGAGDDVIDLYNSHGPVSVDGGAGQDTLRADNLKGYTLHGVETLDTGIVSGSIEQLSAFDKIMRSKHIPSGSSKTEVPVPADDVIWMKLSGSGGKLDLSHLVEKGKSALVDGSKLTSGVEVTGTDRPDALRGSNFSDHLKGGLGNDVLNCNSRGPDTIEGGGGSDLFAFRGEFIKGRFNHIVDFATSESATHDYIGLKGGVFAGLKQGPVAAVAPTIFKDLAAPGTVVDADDRILYNHDTGILSFDPDGSGAAASFQVAVFDNHALLTARDFFIVV